MLRPWGMLSSAALGAVVGTHGRELGVGFGHECLQLLLEELVRGLGCCGLNRGAALGTVLALVLAGGTGVTLMALITLMTLVVALTEIAALAGGILTGLTRLAGLQTLDGQVDLAVLIADDHNLHVLTLGQVLTDVADVGVGHFGNMYHAGLVIRQGDECAEIGDGLDFTL